MNRLDILKERYKRNNETENLILCAVIDTVPDIIIFDKYNTVSVIEFRVKETKGKSRLFLDAENSNFTEYGNHRITEFLYVNVTDERYWIDAKHLNTTTNIADAMYGEFERAKNCTGNVYFFHAGKGYTARTIEAYNKYLIDNKLNNKIRALNDLEKLKSIFN